MPAKIPPTKKDVRAWFLHLIIFLVVNAILWVVCFSGKEGWVYPWPAWITAAWSLLVIGHASLVWANHEDKAYDEWKRQTVN